MRAIEFLQNLEQLRFSGHLTWVDSIEQRWVVYFFRGQLVYATGGAHPVRRWRRQLMLHCPRIPTYRLAWQSDLAGIDDSALALGWEYALLDRWVTQGKITRQQATAVITSVVTEVLFDVLQADNLTDQIQPDNSLVPSLDVVEVEVAVTAGKRQWQSWRAARLGAYSPNSAPVLKQPEQLRRRGSEQFYRNLVNLLDGQRSLRDLSVEVTRDVLELTSSLLPCIQLRWIDLAPIDDQPPPIYRQRLLKPQLKTSPVPITSPKALIACVDDSSMVRTVMEKLLTSAGYQFLGIQDPLRAIGQLLSRKPDLIFLDLMMPQVNGHELCKQLRKISYFQTTPIVILTGNDGYANRLRSNFAGASDFLTKPLDAGAVLNVIRKHLTPNSPSLSAVNSPDSRT